MTEAKVMKLLSDMTGESPEDNGAFEASVKSALEEMTGRLRPEATEYELQKYEERLNYAAAVDAFYRLILIDSLSSPGSVRAGELSIDNRVDRESVEKLLKKALLAVAAVAEPGEFSFMGVEPE